MKIKRPTVSLSWPRMLRFFLVLRSFSCQPVLPLILSLLFVQCQKKSPPPLLEQLSSARTGINFSNQLTEDENLNILTFEYFYNGAGVGIGDFDNDGLKDIFFSANQVPNRLYRNTGSLKFEDITASSGIINRGKWATGVSVIDIDQDGWLDIYVCYAGPFADAAQRANELYVNNHDNTFTEKATTFGLADTGHSTQAAFFDYDLDGDLDVYLLTNITGDIGPNIIRPKKLKGEMVNTDRLYRNNGDLTFTNISADAGITIEGYGLGVSICDINRDGWPDIYVSNDYLSNDLMYINNSNGTFTDHAAIYFDHTSYSAMGNDVADFNNDGLVDILTVDMLPEDNKRQKLMFGATNYDRYQSEIKTGYSPQFMRNSLQLNRGLSTSGDVVFSEIGQLAGVSATDWSWTALFVDLDNDGLKDIFITNGYPKDITNRDFASYKAHEFMQKGYTEGVKNKLLTAISTLEGAYIPNYVFQNKGDLTFQDRSAEWGFTQPSYSTGAAYADLDNDGDLDLAVNNTNAQAFIVENHSGEQKRNHFLRIKLNGPASNQGGHGAKVWLVTPGNEQFLEYSPYRGFQSTMENQLHFGLGKDSIVTSLAIRWPDGREQLLKNIKADQLIEVNYGSASPAMPHATTGDTAPLFKEVTQDRTLSIKHTETHYADFKVQPLLPHKYSQQGPGIAVADINNDEKDDFFIGGAYNQSGMLGIQDEHGKFRSKALVGKQKFEEEMGAVFFDADQDGDQDLYVVSGGNEFGAGSAYYQDKLYRNDGRGNFEINPLALPAETASGSCVVACDFDRDGDLDLFVGGRLSPQNYPTAGESFLLENRNGKFTDVTEKLAPGLKNIGMVTAALWTDVDDDTQMDLMIVGEWMPVTLFKNFNGILKQAPVIAGTSGWWNSITGADIDGDGDTDYILGNLGLNSKFKTTKDKPVRIYVDDFNGDGKKEALLGNYLQGVNYPVHPRDDLFQQMPNLKRLLPDYKTYSELTMDEFLAATKSVSPLILHADIFASGIMVNEGKGKFNFNPLPMEAQFAPVYGIVTGDFNLDGTIDILLTGNSFAPDVLTGRYDALKGLYLGGDGLGNFKPLSLQQSGWFVVGDGKGLATLAGDKQSSVILSATNDGPLQAWEYGKGGFLNPEITPHDIYAIATLTTGKKIKLELYYGSGYLSQSSRMLRIPSKDVERIDIIDYTGKSRQVKDFQR